MDKLSQNKEGKINVKKMINKMHKINRINQILFVKINH